MSQKLVFIFFILLMNGQILLSQSPIYKHFTTEEGLPHDITYQIIQDRNGFIWAGTDDGLARYDGKNFTAYTYEHGLKSNYVIDIYEKGENDFLLATWGAGVQHFKNDTIVSLISEKKYFNKINKIYSVNDSIYFAKGMFSYLLNAKTRQATFFNLKKEENTPYPIVYSKYPEHEGISYDYNQKIINDTLYFFSNDINLKNLSSLKGLYYLSSREKILPAKFEGISDYEIHSIAKEGAYTYLNSFDKIHVFQQSKKIKTYDLNIPNERIINCKIKNNLIYFVTYNTLDISRKIYSFNLNNQILTNISKKININSLISDFIIDKDNALWITTYGKGIYYLPPISHTFFGGDFFSNPDIKDVAIGKNELVALAPDNLYEIKNDQLTSKIALTKLTEKIQLNKDEIALINYFDQIDNIKLGNYTVKSQTSKRYSISYGNTDFLFQSVYVTIKKGKSEKEIKLTHGSNILIDAVQRDNLVYLIFSRIGILVYDLEKQEIVKLLNENNGYYSDFFKDLIFVEDTLWLASNLGLIKVTPKEKKLFTTHKGLSGNQINNLCLDKHGVLWIATQKGLNVLKNDFIYTFGRNLGQNSSFVTKVIEWDDHIYAAGNNGLIKINNETPFKPRSFTDINIIQKNDLFEINTINFFNSNSVKIAYQLNNEPWIEFTNKKLNFSAVKAGKHNVTFKYKDDLSDWKLSKKYSFTIHEPWYQSIWANTLIILLLSSIIIFFIYQQLMKARKKNRIFQEIILEREKLQNELKNTRHQIAQDFHDDLGNKLASISIMSNLLLKKTETTNSSYQNIIQINEDANFLYSGMRDFIWALDFENNKLNEVQLYLNEFGERLFQNTGIAFISKNNISDSEIILPHYWNKEIVLTFKEAMTNALKHSQASKIEFDVSLIQSQLEISLKDNGIGFDSKKIERINGLNNMKKRMKSLGISLTITSTNGVHILLKATL